MKQSWPEVRLGDIAHFKNGLNYSKQDFGHGLKVIGVGDFGNRSRFSNFASLAEIDPAKIGGSIPTLRDGDILFVRSNGNRELIGRSATVRGLTEKVSFSGFTIRCRFYSEMALPDYFSFLFKGHVVRDVLSSFGGGTNINNLNQEILANLKIPLPPLPIQRKIAAILSAYDDLIENNTRRVQVLEQMARDLYREWFVEFRFPGHETAEFMEDEHGRRPEGWMQTTLGAIAFETRRAVEPASLDPETRYVGLEHIPRRTLALNDWGRVTDVQSTKLKFDQRDILFGKIRPYFHKVAVAPVSGVCSSDAIVIKAQQPEWWPLVVMTVSSDEFVDHSVQTSNGTKMPRANWSVLVKYEVHLPPIDLLHNFNTTVKSVIEQGANLTLRNANLRRTRDLLLPKLVSGELDVSALDVRGPGLEPVNMSDQTQEAVA